MLNFNDVSLDKPASIKTCSAKVQTMKLTFPPLFVRGPFVIYFACGFLLALCLGLAGCASPPAASGHAATPTVDTQQALEARINPVPAGVSGKLTATAPPDGTRQFTAGGHVLGFAAGSVLVASGSHALKVEFVNANPVDPHSDQPGGDGKDHQAPELTEVRYPGLWQGIDLSYKADPNGIAETVWKLEPGADINLARLRYNRPLALNKDGSLNIRYPTGNLTESAPIAWQEKNGRRQPVTVAFALNGAQELGFKLGDHDPAQPVWIDPTLSWNTFLGGAGGGSGAAIAVDGSGNIYVVGISDATWGSPQRAFTGGAADNFVAKLDSSGQLIWNTFLGGDGDESVLASIAVDGSGNVYVAGTSYATWGSPQRAFGGNSDAFVAKLNSLGQLVWNTFLGGNGWDYSGSIEVDGSGNVYVTGTSGETWGNPKQALSLGYNAHVAKLDSGTGQLVWNTFYNEAARYVFFSSGYGIALDGNGNVYVTGTADSVGIFVAKFDSTGQRVWSALLGHAADDGQSIAVDGSGNVYVTGTSNASWGSPQRAYGGYSDAFVAKLDSTGKLVWNTFLGGTGITDSFGESIAVDGSGNVYIAGESRTSWGSPLLAFKSLFFGNAFAAQIDSSGKLIWNAFLGGLYGDTGKAIAVDSSGNVYVAGGSQDTWGSPLRAFSGNVDAFVAKIAKLSGSTATAVTSNANPASYEQTVTFTASVSGSGGTPTGTVTFTADGNAITGCGTNGVVSLSGGSAACASSALTAAGSPHAITATYNGDATYDPSSGSLANGQTVNKANVTVTTWPAASAITYGQSLANSTLSGGAATPAGSFAFTSPAFVPPVGTAAQSVTYTPTDTGNYNTATHTVSVTVGSLNKANQTLLFSPVAPLLVGNTATLSATGGASGNPVTFNSTTPSVCTTSGTDGSTVTGVSAGSCSITADQAGNANYNAAPQVTQTFSVTTGVALTVINSNKTFGTITSDAGGIACGATSSAHFINGTLVKLTASPAAGYQFSGWGGACIGYGNTYSVTMNADKSCTGNFEPFKKKRSPGWRKWLLSQ
jgi:hypothetical protein